MEVNARLLPDDMLRQSRLEAEGLWSNVPILLIWIVIIFIHNKSMDQIVMNVKGILSGDKMSLILVNKTIDSHAT